MILRLKFNYSGVEACQGLVFTRFALLLDISAIHSEYFHNSRWVHLWCFEGRDNEYLSICNKVMTRPDNSTMEYHNWLIEPSKFVFVPQHSSCSCPVTAQVSILISIVGSKVCHWVQLERHFPILSYNTTSDIRLEDTGARVRVIVESRNLGNRARQ